MPKFAANLSFLFNELPFLERFAAARSAGFDAVEFMFPYDHPADQIREQLDRNNLELVLFNTTAGSWAEGERGMLAIPGREQKIDAALELALHYATALGCKKLHAMSGLTQHGASLETLAVNLVRAADIVAAAGIDILIEPINSRDMPGYVLTRTSQALAILDQANRTNIGLQFDFYHRHIMDGSIEAGFAEALPRIKHIQIASPPDRGEPDHGEIDYSKIFDLIDRSGYEGWVGCEYKPRRSTLEGLGWLSVARSRL